MVVLMIAFALWPLVFIFIAVSIGAILFGFNVAPHPVKGFANFCTTVWTHLSGDYFRLVPFNKLMVLLISENSRVSSGEICWNYRVSVRCVCLRMRNSYQGLFWEKLPNRENDETAIILLANRLCSTVKLVYLPEQIGDFFSHKRS